MPTMLNIDNRVSEPPCYGIGHHAHYVVLRVAICGGVLVVGNGSAIPREIYAPRPAGPTILMHAPPSIAMKFGNFRKSYMATWPWKKWWTWIGCSVAASTRTWTVVQSPSWSPKPLLHTLL